MCPLIVPSYLENLKGSYRPLPLCPYFLTMHILDTLQLSAANTTVASRAMSPFLLIPSASLKSTILAITALSSRVREAITTLFLFTKSDLKTVLIPVVSVHSDTPWFCAKAENHLWPLDRLCCPLTT